MLDAEKQRQEAESKQEWMRSLIVTQAVQNIFAKRQRPLDSLYKKAFGPSAPEMTLAEYRERRDRALKHI